MTQIDSSIALNKAGADEINFPALALIKGQLDMGRMQQERSRFEMEQAQRQLQEQQRLRGIVSQAGSPEEIYSGLMKGGYLNEATAYKKQLLEQQGTVLSQQEQMGKILKQSSGAVLANPTEQTAISVLDNFAKMTGSNVDQEKAQIYGMRGDPNAIKQWAAGYALEADKLLPKIETRDLGGSVETQQVNPVTGEVIGTQARGKTMTPGEIASNQVARANLAVNQGKLALDQTKETRESTAQQKLNMKVANDLKKEELRNEHSMQKIKTVMGSIDDVIAGTRTTTSGVFGKAASMVPGTDAYDLDKKIDTIKANIAFGALQQMREASPTGGALGAVAVRELELLESTLGSLDIGQSTSQKMATLKQIKQHFKNWEDTLKQAKGQSSSSAQPQTQEVKVKSLPDPSQYQGYEAEGSDGVIYVSDGSRWVRRK